MSASTVRRWLAADALKPWQHRSWIFPRDPDFAVKAARVLDLYARVFDGEPLGENDYVLSADEKPGVQARSRIHPSRTARPGRRPMRVESEYRRHGTLAYLAAYDVHRAHVIGHCAPSHRHRAVHRAGRQGHDQQALRLRAASVLDRRQRLLPPRLDRRSTPVPTRSRTRRMIHLPVHASWLNQVEIYFSVVQRKLLTPDDFADLDDLADQITAFEAPLQHRRPTLRLALQPQRPQPAPQPDRRMTPDELTGVTTWPTGLGVLRRCAAGRFERRACR